MWIVVIIIIVILIAVAANNGNAIIKRRNFQRGGIQQIYSNYVKYFQFLDLDLISDTGLELVYRRREYYGEDYYIDLYLIIECKTLKNLYAYSRHPSGRKILGLRVNIFETDTIDIIELTIKKILDDLNMQSGFDPCKFEHKWKYVVKEFRTCEKCLLNQYKNNEGEWSNLLG